MSTNSETVKLLEYAHRAMSAVEPDLVDRFVGLIEFLTLHPQLATTRRSRHAPSVLSHQYISETARGFAMGRARRVPTKPATVPDPMVAVILRDYWKIEADHVSRAVDEHQLAMASENIIGSILEHYIASVIEHRGWIWCSGEYVRSVDFIARPTAANGAWRMLQVKNRDNSENSSSARVREGTEILKWHRSFSRRPQTNWPAFPDPAAVEHLSEDGFVEFTSAYLTADRTRST